MIALPVAYSNRPYTNEQGIVSGFGLTSTDALIWMDYLNPKSTYQRVMDTGTCRSKLGTSFVTASHFCASNYESQSRVCYGDEGAGLVVHVNLKPTVVGVLSRVVNLCDKNQPAIYTRVDPYVDWIKAVAGM